MDSVELMDHDIILSVFLKDLEILHRMERSRPIGVEPTNNYYCTAGKIRLKHISKQFRAMTHL